MPQEFASLAISDLTAGVVLTSPIFDSSKPNSKLLGKDVEITDRFLQKLEARGITSVSVSKRDIAAINAGAPQGISKKVDDHNYAATNLSTEKSQEIDEEIQSADLTSDIPEAESTERDIQIHSDRYDQEAISDEVQKREQVVAYTEDLFVKLVKGDGTDTEAISGICREAIASVVQDKDLFLCLGINPYDSEYPSRHSMHVSSVAISIGVMLGLDDQSLVDLGTGCLIHDVGMLKLDQRLFRAKRKLKDNELSTLAEHPILTMDALACPGVRLSRVARIVAYQIHERCNGSGYPRGVRSEEIHYLAKIAAVADAYVGLVSNRWHRRGLMPYYAMEKILNSIPVGLFDGKVVRGLLHVVSLFPIGSFVETSDGRTARVVRSTGETYRTPIIEIWNDKHQQFEPDLIDLRKDDTTSITRAIAKAA